MTISSLLSTQVSATRLVALEAPGADTVMSLEQRLLESFATSAVETHQKAASIKSMFSQADMTDPAQLARLQQLASNYNIDVSMVNALVRKGVSTVETLLRSS